MTVRPEESGAVRSSRRSFSAPDWGVGSAEASVAGVLVAAASAEVAVADASDGDRENFRSVIEQYN